MHTYKLHITSIIYRALLLFYAGQGGGAGGAAGAAGGAGGAAGGAVVPGTQDAIQIVAQAALCFDNRQVMILLPAPIIMLSTSMILA